VFSGYSVSLVWLQVPGLRYENIFISSGELSVLPTNSYLPISFITFYFSLSFKNNFLFAVFLEACDTSSLLRKNYAASRKGNEELLIDDQKW